MPITSYITQKEELLSAMRAGATIITPNNRLSQQWLRTFFYAEASHVVEKPLCLPYQRFRRHLYEAMCEIKPFDIHPLLLSPQQTQHLFQCVITSPSVPNPNASQIAAIQSAFADCLHWQLDLDHPSFQYTPQTRQFQRWIVSIKEHLDSMHAIIDEQIIDYILPNVSSYKQTMKHACCIWVCFNEFTPEQQTLQDVLDDNGVTQVHYDIAANPNSAHQVVATNPEAEYLQMIQWLQNLLAKREHRIAIVVPSLDTEASHITRLIKKHIPDEQIDLSLGKPLTHYPLVSHAILCLGLDKQAPLDAHLAQHLLYSAYIRGSKTEFIARTQLMQDSRLLQSPLFSWEQFIRELTPRCDILVKTLESMPAYPESASPSTWVKHFTARLNALGFPGEYSLQSVNYQCYQRFLILFDEFSSLSLITPQMSLPQALSTFEILATSTIFQPQKNTAPVQIMGQLEADGCSFDHLWITGLTDQVLPQKAMPSPFIPLELQRKYNMPRALAARELRFAKQSLQRLKNGSNTCVASYPRFLGDNPQLPSPLIRNWPIFPAVTIPETPRHISLIECHEDYVVPIAENETTSGGASLLAYQAQCPFRAFAAYRLHAKSPDDASIALNARERGQLMHDTMERIWSILGDHHTLCQTNERELEQHVDEAISHAFQAVLSPTLSLPDISQDVEKHCLKHLILTTLSWEKEREPFRVAALEKTYTITLADMTFNVRIDRLDKLEDEGAWIIDYKTSLPAHSSPWYDERPEAPQLLLYALLDEQISGLIFLQLKAGNVTCKGFSRDNVPIKGIRSLKKDESWEEYRKTWHDALSTLADEYKAGQCVPLPQHTSTCSRCEFGALCRV